ncbi:MAG TPA: VOC family protein, partial [Roseiarcus sp.]
EFARLKDKIEVIHEPKLMPWGNCAAQFRDPEGTAVSLFMPATDAAKARFASR